MRIFATTLLAMGLGLGAHAQDATRDSELVTSVDTADMRYIIESAGYTVTQDLSTGIGLVGEASNGLIFGLSGKACSDSPNCVGLEAFVILEGEYSAENANAVNERWSAVKATSLEGDKLYLSRYLILDHGQTLQNLRLNLETTVSIAKQYYDEGQKKDEETQLTASAIDWGDDAGAYANDDACDDARFHGDGDDWTYQRQHVLHDATDCRSLFEAGSISLFLDFGDNSGEYANDDTCDDNRFTGEGRSVWTLDNHVKRDAADCIAAYQAETLSRP